MDLERALRVIEVGPRMAYLFAAGYRRCGLDLLGHNTLLLTV